MYQYTKIAIFYAKMLGQIPKIIRQGVLNSFEQNKIGQLIVIIQSNTKNNQRPLGRWGGGNDHYIGPYIIIGTDLFGFNSHSLSFLALLHEGAHTYFDREYYHGLYKEEWNNAVANDNNRFISPYAKKHPRREDVAESFTVYIVLKYLNNRISKYQYNKLMETIPNRIKLFDSTISEDEMIPMSISNYPIINYEKKESQQNKLFIIIPSVVGSLVLISVIIFLVLKYRYRKF